LKLNLPNQTSWISSLAISFKNYILISRPRWQTSKCWNCRMLWNFESLKGDSRIWSRLQKDLHFFKVGSWSVVKLVALFERFISSKFFPRIKRMQNPCKRVSHPSPISTLVCSFVWPKIKEQTSKCIILVLYLESSYLSVSCNFRRITQYRTTT